MRPPHGDKIRVNPDLIQEHADGSITVVGELVNGATYMLTNGDWRKI